MEIDLTENQLVLWLQNHGDVSVSLKWSDILQAFNIRVSRTDRHISFCVNAPLVEAHIPHILDELLLRLEDIPPWQPQNKF